MPEDMVVDQLPDAPPLPDQQIKGKRGAYPREVTDHYLQRYGLTPADMQKKAVRYLVKSKVDSDIFCAQQGKTIRTLEAKVALLLAFVGKYSHLPRKVACS